MKRLYPKKILYVLYTFSCRFAHRRQQAAGSKFKVPSSRFAHRFTQILKIIFDNFLIICGN